MADGLRVGELLPEVQKKFTQEELDQILRVGSVSFLAVKILEPLECG